MPQHLPHAVRDLMSQHAAVAHFTLNAQSIAVTARDDSGAIVLAEVYRSDGTIDSDAAAVLASARQLYLGLAEQAMNHLVAVLAHRRAGGEDLNMADLSRRLDVARSTLYLRLDGETVAKGATRAPRPLSDVLAS